MFLKFIRKYGRVLLELTEKQLPGVAVGQASGRFFQDQQLFHVAGLKLRFHYPATDAILFEIVQRERIPGLEGFVPVFKHYPQPLAQQIPHRIGIERDQPLQLHLTPLVSGRRQRRLQHGCGTP